MGAGGAPPSHRGRSAGQGWPAPAAACLRHPHVGPLRGPADHPDAARPFAGGHHRNQYPRSPPGGSTVSTTEPTQGGDPPWKSARRRKKALSRDSRWRSNRHFVPAHFICRRSSVMPSRIPKAVLRMWASAARWSGSSSVSINCWQAATASLSQLRQRLSTAST